MKSEKRTTSNYAEKICGSLNENGKKIVVLAVSRMRKADGTIDAEEVNLIHEHAGALELSKPLINNLLKEEGIPTI